MRSRFLTQAALVAALYAGLAYLQNLLIPGSGSFLIQFRAAEALCVLALFTPGAIPGLAMGCLLFNLSFAPALPLDALLGSAATAAAGALMWLTRNIKIKGFPLLGLLMPAAVNGLVIGWELSFSMGGGFWLNCGYVAAGEALVLLTLGAALYYAMKAHRLESRIFR